MRHDAGIGVVGKFVETRLNRRARTRVINARRGVRDSFGGREHATSARGWGSGRTLNTGPPRRKRQLTRRSHLSVTKSRKRPLVPVTRDTLASPFVSSLIDDSVSRASPLGVPAIPLAGGPLDARLPLALLEAVKAIDTPEAELDAELVHELRNKRLGLSETVLSQIRRYQDAVKRQQPVAFDEVLALARLIGRRPDADLAFREAGRRWARAAISTIGATSRGAATTLPALMGRPIALRQLRGIARRFMGATLVRQGSTLQLDVSAPVSADAAPRGAGCGLYEAAFRESLHVLADADGAVEHVLCRSRGDARCQWRAEWRRR